MTAPKMPDRRAAVKGLALSALMAAPAAASAPTLDRSAWNAAVAAYDRALAAYDAAEVTLARARDAYHQARPVKPPNSLVHHDHEPKSEFDRKAAELRASVDLWRAAEAACRKAHRVDELDAALNHASSGICDALDTIMPMPAPDFAAVVHKIELAVMEGIDSVDMDHILSDIRRLGGL